MENTIANNCFVLGVDIGGSHITAAVVDMKNKIVVNATTVRRRVKSDGNPEEILGAWLEVIDEVINRFPIHIRFIGIAMPGPFDYENGISLIQNMNKYDSIYGYNIKQIIAERLAIEPANIQFRNDAEAFLEGEVVSGVAYGYNRAIGITLGTGLGSAKSINGVTEDVNLGSSPYLDGIAEDYISTRWFIKRYHELTGRNVKDAKEVAQLINIDQKAKLVFEEFSDNLGKFLYNFIESEKAEVVVIGGNIANASTLFLSKLEDKLTEYFPDVFIRIATLGEDAALIGAVSCFETSLQL